MKRILLIIASVTILGTSGYYIYQHYIFPKNNSSSVAGKEAQNPAVSVLTIHPALITQTRSFNGRVSAFKISPVRPQVGGVIQARLFQEGEEVKAGQQLYQIDPAPYLVALNTAKAQLQKAEAVAKAQQSKIARYKKLVQMNAIGRQDYDDTVASFAEAQADIAIARAAVESAELNLSYTKVYAPIDGKTGFSMVTEGALVTADQGDSLTTITQLNPIYVDFTAQADELAPIRAQQQQGAGEQIKFVIGDQKPEQKEGDKMLAGQLEFSDVTIDPSTGTVKTRVKFSNDDHQLRPKLLPGEFVKIVAMFPQQSALLVPQSAAIRGADGRLSVWVITADQTVRRQPIEAQQTYQNQWILQGGLNKGDRIATAGFQKIKDGQAVTIAPDKTEEKTQDKTQDKTQEKTQDQARKTPQQ